jgi:dienelactone hydrolase
MTVRFDRSARRCQPVATCATTRRMIERRWLALALLALALCGCGGGSNGGAPAPVEPDGSFAIGQTNFVFVDTSRPTAPNHGVPGKDSRTLKTVVYYPAAGAPGGVAITDATPVSGHRFPLIVFGHGFTAVARIYFTILQGWAAAGYVVAAPDFPLSSGGTEGGPSSDDYINQPADESFIIDQVLALNGDASSRLHGLVDPTRIGASGQSLGGMTTFGIAFNTCCRDRRIGAAVPMAGQLVPFPGGEYDAEIGPPVLIIHGDADDTVDYSSAIEAYAFALPPKLLLTHLGGGHILPYVGSSDAAAVAATIDSSTAFFDLYLKHERGARQRLLAVGTRTRVTLQYDLGE